MCIKDDIYPYLINLNLRILKNDALICFISLNTLIFPLTCSKSPSWQSRLASSCSWAPLTQSDKPGNILSLSLQLMYCHRV